MKTTPDQRAQLRHYFSPLPSTEVDVDRDVRAVLDDLDEALRQLREYERSFTTIHGPALVAATSTIAEVERERDALSKDYGLLLAESNVHELRAERLRVAVDAAAGVCDAGGDCGQIVDAVSAILDATLARDAGAPGAKEAP